MEDLSRGALQFVPLMFAVYDCPRLQASSSVADYSFIDFEERCQTAGSACQLPALQLGAQAQ